MPKANIFQSALCGNVTMLFSITWSRNGHIWVTVLFWFYYQQGHPLLCWMKQYHTQLPTSFVCVGVRSLTGCECLDVRWMLSSNVYKMWTRLCMHSVNSLEFFFRCSTATLHDSSTSVIVVLHLLIPLRNLFLLFIINFLLLRVSLL